MLTINVDSATLPTQLPASQGKCWADNEATYNTIRKDWLYI